MKKTGFILLGLMILMSCGGSGKFQKVVIENKYWLEVPSRMHKTTELNDQASLQYINDSLGLYAMVIDETKNDVYQAFEQNELTDKYTSDFTGYSKLILDNYYTNLEITQKSEVSELKINNLRAKKITIDGKYGGVDKDFYFCIALIEGKERFYQIMIWTPKDKKEKNIEVMDEIINTFAEL
jgi:hypothetical protein